MAAWALDSAQPVAQEARLEQMVARAVELRVAPAVVPLAGQGAAPSKQPSITRGRVRCRQEGSNNTLRLVMNDLAPQSQWRSAR